MLRRCLPFLATSDCPNLGDEHGNLELKRKKHKDADFDAFPRQRYEFGRTLEHSVFGDIVLAYDKTAQRQVVVKQSSLRLVNDAACVRSEKRTAFECPLRECSLMRTLAPHPNVLTMLAEYEDKKCHYMVTEYMGKGDLLNMLNQLQTRQLPLDLVRHYFRQVVFAVQHVHRNNLAHLDVSLENVLIDDDDCAKLCDFGLARPMTRNTMFAAGKKFGKTHYVCPAVYQKRAFSGTKADCYSLGVVLFVLLTGTFPYDKPVSSDAKFQCLYKGNLRANIKQWADPTQRRIPGVALDLVQQLICPPGRRISIQQILEHPYFL